MRLCRLTLHSHLGEGLGDSDDGFKLADGDGHWVGCLGVRARMVALPLFLTDLHILPPQSLCSPLRQPRNHSSPAILNVSFQVEHVLFPWSCTLLCLPQAPASTICCLLAGVPVHTQNVLGQLHVLVPGPFVLHDEDEVEAGQDGSLEVDVVCGGLHIVISPRGRVGGGHYSRARVEHSGDASFCNGNSLLFHCLVNGNSVLWAHLIKLIYTHYSSVRKHHCSALQECLPRGRVLDDGCGETGSGGTLARGINGNGCGAINKLEDLRLGRGGVAQQ
mmetsp:Transcript_25578/g.35307  ORF Transcript_25578/g.35307 Transcript_25578/m.35307 type:complete len:276 (-) Transcript_25578:1237-2064(-)